MAGKRVHFVMPEDLVGRIDAARSEGESRGQFVRRILEQALSATPSPAEKHPAAPVEQPSRADLFRRRDVRPYPKGKP